MATLRSPKPLMGVRIPPPMPKYGSVAERLKAPVLKTGERQRSVSSNLTASAKYVSVAEWLRTGLQIRKPKGMQVRVLSLTPI